MTPVFRSLSPILRSAALCTVILLSAGLTGCATAAEPHVLNSPSTSEAPASPSPTQPDYTTDLQLSEEEKKAVEEALVALQKYVDVTNEVLGSGGEGAEKYEDVAKDAALHMSHNDSKQLKNKNHRMSGIFSPGLRMIHEVDLEPSDETAIPFISAHACVRLDEFEFVNETGSSIQEQPEDDATFEFVLANYEGTWYVSEQNLIEYSCD